MFAQAGKRPRESELLIEREAPSGHEAKKHRPLSWQTVPRVPESLTDLDHTLRFRRPTLTPVDSSDDEGEDQTGASRESAYKSARASTVLVQSPLPPGLQINPARSHAETKPAPLVNGDILSPWLSSAHHVGSVQPSPIPQNLINQSLNISVEPPGILSHSYFPTTSQLSAVNNAPHLEPDALTSMEGVSFHRDEQHPTIAVRLPSPISDDDATMTSSGKTPPSDADMAFYSPYTSSPAPSFPQSAPVGVDPSAPSSYYHQSSNSLKSQDTCGAPGTPRKKPALVMGYRADCDKCRRRVPGHYSHIIRP